MTERFFDLVLSKEALPRTITRERWREIDRWRRNLRKAVAEQVDRDIARMRHHDDLPEGVRQHMIDRIVNPPIFAWPSK